MRGIIRELFGWIIFIVLVVAASYVVVTFVGQRTQVSGESMETTLADGDHLIVDKISYRFRDPKRYDIVVFPYRYAENTYYIKRIIGLPGETVQITDGKILINGEEVSEDIHVSGIEYAGLAEEPVELGDDEYFVMGDNGTAGGDSRDPGTGNVKKEEIRGKAWYIASPSEDRGTI